MKPQHVEVPGSTGDFRSDSPGRVSHNQSLNAYPKSYDISVYGRRAPRSQVSPVIEQYVAALFVDVTFHVKRLASGTTACASYDESIRRWILRALILVLRQEDTAPCRTAPLGPPYCATLVNTTIAYSAVEPVGTVGFADGPGRTERSRKAARVQLMLGGRQ